MPEILHLTNLTQNKLIHSKPYSTQWWCMHSLYDTQVEESPLDHKFHKYQFHDSNLVHMNLNFIYGKTLIRVWATCGTWIMLFLQSRGPGMQQTIISHRVCVDYPRALSHDTPLLALSGGHPTVLSSGYRKSSKTYILWMVISFQVIKAHSQDE